MAETLSDDTDIDLTIIIVSYNTRELLLRCLQTVYEETSTVKFEVIVYDNASSDGSVEAVRLQFPKASLISCDENLGFARANNEAAKLACGKWLLLLNPDTEVYDRAIDRIVAFGEDNLDAGIYGGRTVFPDGSLNIASCWNKMTLWSVFCHAVGLTAALKRTWLFDTEAIGSWKRDTVRHVDIVVGCFLLIKSSLWDELCGFDEKYWMYGEEVDLCHRARKVGYHPLITPGATIMHLVGATSASNTDKVLLVAKARVTLIRAHWSAMSRSAGVALMWFWAASRLLVCTVLDKALPAKFSSHKAKWRRIWLGRHDWLAGY